MNSITDDVVAARAAAGAEPDWLRDRRLAAAKRYLDQPWPDSRKDELWRATPFKRFDVTLPLITEVGGQAAELVRDGLTASTAHAAVARIWDGGITEIVVEPSEVNKGLVVMSLSEAATTHEALVREHLGSLTTSNDEGTGADEDRTITASDAAWGPGIFVLVPAEVEIAGPIGIRVHITTPGAHQPRVLVVLEHHAQAVVYLEHTSSELAETATVNEVVEVVLGDGAQLDVVSLQEWQSDHIGHLSLQKVAAHRDSTYRHTNVMIGGGTVRVRPEIDLIGPGAACYPVGVYFTDEGQHFDMQPFIRHIAPNTTSDLLYKGALQGSSRANFRGTVYVDAKATGTVTNETNRTLLLSEGARADSTPVLEIFCSDITAGHGSATGQIDEDYLFYLAARGISREEAIRLIVFGFFRDVLDRVALEGVQDRAMTHIEREIDSVDITAIAPIHRPNHAPGAKD